MTPEIRKILNYLYSSDLIVNHVINEKYIFIKTKSNLSFIIKKDNFEIYKKERIKFEKYEDLVSLSNQNLPLALVSGLKALRQEISKK
ncbi:hypothetical protein [Mycoplasma sp. P36-A1]|uniref:hypothetical protein n=1 Tax=Mycoplasma sp. P36-A1 TaxID=3252900 RepID=UPI003C2CBCBB